ISFREALQGRTTEKTFCSRMRRAMSCEYCAPKSRMTIDWFSTDEFRRLANKCKAGSVADARSPKSPRRPNFTQERTPSSAQSSKARQNHYEGCGVSPTETSLRISSSRSTAAGWLNLSEPNGPESSGIEGVRINASNGQSANDK